jgi:hypothetical protein
MRAATRAGVVPKVRPVSEDETAGNAQPLNIKCKARSESLRGSRTTERFDRRRRPPAPELRQYFSIDVRELAQLVGDDWGRV